MPWLEPVSLRGAHARLEPLSHEHCDGLTEAARTATSGSSGTRRFRAPKTCAKEIDRRLGLQAAGAMLPFTVFDADGKIAGMTTYMNVDAAEPPRRDRLDLVCQARAAQRAQHPVQVAVAAHAFEKLDCIAVEFRTHFFNHQSRRAIERLGAKQDGILRNHQIAPNGTLRDTVVFSIIASEWPTVQAHLNYQLNEKAR